MHLQPPFISTFFLIRATMTLLPGYPEKQPPRNQQSRRFPAAAPTSPASGSGGAAEAAAAVIIPTKRVMIRADSPSNAHHAGDCPGGAAHMEDSPANGGHAEDSRLLLASPAMGCCTGFGFGVDFMSPVAGSAPLIEREMKRV